MKTPIHEFLKEKGIDPKTLIKSNDLSQTALIDLLHQFQDYLIQVRLIKGMHDALDKELEKQAFAGLNHGLNRPNITSSLKTFGDDKN